MAYEHKELSGSMFPNRYKQDGDNKPDFVGELKIQGKVWQMAGWKKRRDNGEEWVSLKASEPRPPQQQQAPPAEETETNDECCPF